MSSKPVYRCHVCGAAADTYIVGFEGGGVQVTLPRHFVFAYRAAGQPLGLCNLCFEAGRFEGFTAVEIAYFQEEFTRPDDSPEG